MENIFQIEFLGNTLHSYFVALFVFGGSIAVLRIFTGYAQRRLKGLAEKRASGLNYSIVEVCGKAALPVLYLGAIYISAKQLVLHVTIDKALHSVAIAVLTIQGIRLGLAVFIYFLEQNWLRRTTQRGGAAVSQSILTIAKIVIWGIGIVFLLDNLGFNVAAMVAGLGIGGIAVALACQTILGDLFNYFVIFFDKPFREGDFVVAGDFMGTIEHIGIKSTRIRALAGEEVIISNSNLTSRKISNYKRMNQRRVEFSFRVSHQTSQEQLQKIPLAVRRIVERIEDVKFDRAHFKGIDESGLVIEVVYYVLSSDFNKYMDIQEKINLDIREIFIKEDTEFASFVPVRYSHSMFEGQSK